MQRYENTEENVSEGAQISYEPSQRIQDRVALLKHEETDQQGVAQWAQY